MRSSESNKPIQSVFRFVYALNYISQAAFMLICPAGLIIWGGWVLVHRVGLGKWALIIAIILGILVGLYTMFSFILKTVQSFDPTSLKSNGGTTHGRSSGTARRE